MIIDKGKYLHLREKSERGMRDGGFYLMFNYSNALETVRSAVKRKERVQYVILVCKLLIIQYLLINSYNSFAVN